MGSVNSERGDDRQLELPLEVPSHGRRTPSLRLAGRVLTVLVRWVLRLALPLLCGAAALQALPVHATVQGVPFTVQGTLFSRPGISADTTLGSWEFPHVDLLPVGVHVTPRDVDVLALTQAAGTSTQEWVERLKTDFTAQVPSILLRLAGEFLLGAAVGLAAAAAVNMSVRYLRGLPRRERELRRRAVQLGGAVVALIAVAATGWFTYDPDWNHRSRLTGTLAAAQLFPGQLQAYYNQQTKAFDVLGSVVGIQAALQAGIGDGDQPAPALQIMFISDMHLAANYPLVARYAANYDVDLIVNTGDESEFGQRAELTPAYLDSIRALTSTIPMLWLAGNHDSPQIVDAMRDLPGVTVLGTKTAVDDGYRVTAGVVQAFGLTIAGVSDPRVYGGAAPYGADARKVTDPLERRAVRAAVGADDGPVAPPPSPPGDASTAPAGDGAPAAGQIVDLFATHEPVAADELRAALPGWIRETASGHTHHQNDPGDLQHGSAIDLVEGSTGAGGLDNIVRGEKRPPIEFSIESVSAQCQFTRIVRFSLASSAAGTDPGGAPQAFGDDVTASTMYFRPQELPGDRTCGRQLGIGPAHPW
jgi:predicted MPP superfamily phosphohydrolase